MSFECISCYKCVDCGRVYEVLPEGCICQKRVYFKGQLVGSFIISSELDEAGKVEVVCVLCGLTSKVHISNIRRQVSCGCKPRHAEIKNITKELVIYKCKRCNKLKTERPPIVIYCCEEEEDTGELKLDI